MSVRRTLALGLAAPLLLPLLLSACGGGDDSVADPPISSAPTSSPTRSPRESPEHFIRRWAAEDTKIQRTGETARFREMSRGCKGCLKLAGLVERIYENGGFIHTAGWTVRGISRVSSDTYLLRVFTSATTYSESAGAAVRHLPSGPARFQLELAKNGNSWRVASLVQVAS